MHLNNEINWTLFEILFSGEGYTSVGVLSLYSLLVSWLFFPSNKRIGNRLSESHLFFYRIADFNNGADIKIYK